MAAWEQAPAVDSAPAWASAPAIEEKESPQPPQRQAKKEESSPLDRFRHRAADAVLGASQFSLNLLNLGGKLPNITADFNQRLANREADYQASRPEGIDAAGIAGTIAGTAPFALLPGGQGSFFARTAAGMGTGALAGATQPVTDGGDDFFAEKGKQAAAGAAAAGVLAPLGRIISPKTGAPQQKLLAEGVKLTPGQIAGGTLKRVEDAATSIPIVGDAIRAAQNRSLVSFNEAALNRALGPVGEQLPKNMAGRDGLNYVEKTLSQKYDDLIPKLQFKPDQQFSSEIANIQQMAAQLPPGQAQQFERIFRDKLISKMTPQGNMSGESFKVVEQELSRIAAGYKKSPDFDQQQLGDALRSVLDSARSNVARSNPQYADELAKINEAYANFVRLRRASGALGAEEGLFTPAQLQNAVKAKSGGVDKSQFARGNALMQDLSEAGKAVLPSRVPDSGTATRAAVGLGTLGGTAAINPAIPAALLSGAAAYTPPVQALVRALMTQRPAVAAPLANALPYTGAPSGALLAQLLQANAN